ncbi:ABC transporter ATP-binding protein [Cellulomonas hominis]
MTAKFPVVGVACLAGKNGSGKSTLIELASGYLRPRTGSVTVFGIPAADADARARRRVVRSRPALFPAMTVRDHLLLAAMTTGSDPTVVLKRAAKYGLAPWLDADAGTLSTGTVRKLWVIMCTSGDFGLVLLDEPFTGLDSDTSQVLAAEITAWSRGALVVLATHSAEPGVSPGIQVNVAAGRVDLPVRDSIGGLT